MAWNLGWLGLAPKSWNKAASNFLTGTPEKRENVSTLRPEQEPLYQQLVNAGLRPGAGGAFGEAADYYRSNLSNNPADFAAFANPELRRYNEQTIPGLAEQFAGMGSGALSGSDFRNAAVNAGTDLSERLANIRAGLRQQSAAGLQGIGQVGLGSFSQNMVTQPGSEGFLSSIAPAIGTGIGAAVGGPIGASIGSGLGNSFKNSFGSSPVAKKTSPFGSTGPYGVPQSQQLPNFLQR